MTFWLRAFFLSVITVSLLLGCGGGGGDSSSNTTEPTPTPAAKTKWTYMVYIAGDNNLSDAALDDLNEMETVGSSAAVNIVAMAEFSPTHSIGQSPETQRGKITKDNNLNLVSSLSGMGKNVDMGKKESLVEFITWAKTNYPADNYALVLWSHGDGWKTLRTTGGLQRGALQDESSGSYMSFTDIATAVNSSGGVSLLDFDACLMGMYEIAYQLRQNVGVLVASPEVEPSAGNPYSTILTDLTQTPTMSAKKLADITVERYASSYAGVRDATTKARYDLSTIEPLHQAILALSQYLSTHFTDERGNLQNARGAALEYQEPGNIDLTDFLIRLRTGTTDATLISLINTTLAKIKLTTYFTLNDTAKANAAYTNAGGLAIFLPNTSQTNSEDLSQYALLNSNTTATSWSTIVNQLVSGDTGTPLELTTGNFSYKLTWNDAKADLDLVIWEPDDIYAAWMGTTTANGFFAPESTESGKAEESYTAAAKIAKGDYDIFINYYDYFGACGSPCVTPEITAKLYYKDPAIHTSYQLIDTVKLNFNQASPIELSTIDILTNLITLDNPYSDWWYSSTLTKRIGTTGHRYHKVKPRYAGKYSPLRRQQRHVQGGQ